MQHTPFFSETCKSQARSDDADAFFPDPLRRGPRLRDAVFAHPTLAESLNNLFSSLES